MYDDAHKDGEEESEWLAEVGEAVQAAGDDEAMAVLEKYFDVEALVNMLAFNNMVGARDDWRNRHNCYW